MISVVIPALNEQDAIVDTIERIQKTLEGAGITPYEVVVVDDGSNDKTGEWAQKQGARVVRHPHNVGYGRSLKDGILAAKFDLVAITDADGTYPIESLVDLVERHKEGFDMVVGARTGEHYRESALKVPLRWILRRIVEWTAGRKIPDINSGLRVFRRSTVIQYFDRLCDTFSFTTSLTLGYMMTGRFVDYVPISYDQRIGKSKVRLFSDSLRTLQYILEAAIYYNPMRIFMLFAMGSAFVSAGSFLIALLVRINLFYYFGLTMIVAAIILFSMGLLAALLRQIMIANNPTQQTVDQSAEKARWEAVSAEMHDANGRSLPRDELKADQDSAAG